jgi:hypothetical protein
MECVSRGKESKAESQGIGRNKKRENATFSFDSGGKKISVFSSNRY